MRRIRYRPSRHALRSIAAQAAANASLRRRLSDRRWLSGWRFFDANTLFRQEIGDRFFKIGNTYRLTQVRITAHGQGPLLLGIASVSGVIQHSDVRLEFAKFLAK